MKGGSIPGGNIEIISNCVLFLTHRKTRADEYMCVVRCAFSIYFTEIYNLGNTTECKREWNMIGVAIQEPLPNSNFFIWLKLISRVRIHQSHETSDF